MITNADIKKMLASFIPVFATKQDLENFATKEEIFDIKSNIYSKMDAVYKEVIATRQEQLTHLMQHDNINERLEAIESAPAVAHDLKR